MRKPNGDLIHTIRSLQWIVAIVIVLLGGIVSLLGFIQLESVFTKVSELEFSTDTLRWRAPDNNTIPLHEGGKLIQYGREFINKTDHFIGSYGVIQNKGSGMRCTNCHLNGGTKYFGNNFSAVASTYPKFRPRYGAIETIEKRVNDCIIRSIQGIALDSASYEMRAIVAYIKWLGKDVKKGISPEGAGLAALPFLDRAANPEKGKLIYIQKCVTCHGDNGEGMLKNNSSSFLNPPVWGDKSYTIGAGMYRLGRTAAFVKSNMPWGATFDAPQLSDEEAWDVASYINSMPRPNMNLEKDWPDITLKPTDYPYGPFIDGFTEEQHKYGPYQSIVEAQEKIKVANEKN